MIHRVRRDLVARGERLLDHVGVRGRVRAEHEERRPRPFVGERLQQLRGEFARPVVICQGNARDQPAVDRQRRDAGGDPRERLADLGVQARIFVIRPGARGDGIDAQLDRIHGRLGAEPGELGRRDAGRHRDDEAAIVVGCGSLRRRVGECELLRIRVEDRRSAQRPRLSAQQLDDGPPELGGRLGAPLILDLQQLPRLDVHEQHGELVRVHGARVASDRAQPHLDEVTICAGELAHQRDTCAARGAGFDPTQHVLC